MAMKSFVSALILMLIMMLSGCGATTDTGGTTAVTTATGGTTIVPGADQLTVTISAATLLSGDVANVTATLIDGSGQPLVGEQISFTTNHVSDSISGSGISITNAQGNASISLIAGALGGTGKVTATSSTASGFASYSVSVGSIVLAMPNPANPLVNLTNAVIGNPNKITAKVVDGNNQPVSSAIVTFTTDTAIGTISPASNTALTNLNGLATVDLSGVAAGAAVITGTVQVGTAALEDSLAYSVTTANTTTSIITMPTAIRFGAAPLSAYGSTTVAVDVFAQVPPAAAAKVNFPMPVNFSSQCVSQGKATITAVTNTMAGTATAIYRDNGCAIDDIITASASGASISGTLTVMPPSSGSIQFVSALPTHIVLKGTGGLGLQETSNVTFKVLDTAGQPIAQKVVTFELSTYVGGITPARPVPPAPPVTGVTDISGLITIAVSSGTVSTPVRVLASTPGTTNAAGITTTLQSQSDVLTISTGSPDQDSTSLGPATLNIEGLGFNGTRTVLTVRLGDHFNNPVPDGTAVNFIAEGGQMEGTCITVNSACTATFTSANPKPADGRVTILAYAVGEESFIDQNGNGLADNISEMIGINDPVTAVGTTDMPEAFVDFNEDGLYNGIEPFIDFDNLGTYTPADNKYSGSLCDTTVLGFCSPSKRIHVRASTVVVLSGSTPSITQRLGIGANLGGNLNAPAIQCNTPVTSSFVITDVNGNALPAGSSVVFSTTNGALVGDTSFVVPNTAARWLPAIAAIPTALNYTVNLVSDATYNVATGICTDRTLSGFLSIKVTTPNGVVTTNSYPVAN